MQDFAHHDTQDKLCELFGTGRKKEQLGHTGLVNLPIISRRIEASLLYLGSFSSTICTCFARYSAVYHGDRAGKAQIETKCYEMQQLWLLVDADWLMRLIHHQQVKY